MRETLPGMVMLSLGGLSLLCTAAVAQQAFVNSISVPEHQDLYEFNWTVEHWETMFLYDKSREAGTPVIIDSQTGVYSKRAYNGTSQRCELRDMTEEEITQVTTADGFHRRTTLVNKQLPGPTIVVWKGAQVAVRVRNKLIQEGVAIHWHGITQHNTPWMDGVGGVSQCPINPGESFTYRFTASEGGTHWWHAHLGTFRTDGLYGALIVLENDTAEPPLPVFHKEFVLLVHDWQREDSLETYLRVEWEATRFSHGYGDTDTCRTRLTQADGTDLGPVHFTSGLINGKGRSYDNNDNAENRFIPLEKFSVEGNMTYRFRVISAAMVFPFRVSVDQHELTLIATDGDRIREQTAESFIINTGERYDFYITTNQPAGNYWIRADTIELYADGDPVSTQHHTEAILHYEGAPDAEPTSQRKTCAEIDSCTVVNCPFRQYGDPSMYIECLPVHELRSPGNGSVPMPESEDSWEEHFINFHFAGSDMNRGQRSSVNGHRFVPPSTPPQVTGDKGLKACTDELCGGEKYCDCSYHVTITPGNVVQMVLYNMGFGAGLDGTAHPVHIHGHHFHVLDMGFPQYNSVGRYVSQNPDIDCGTSDRCNGKRWADQAWEGGNKPGLNLLDPPLKDTVIVPVGGYVVIRFAADNPGWWFVHCHIEIHQVEGMAMMIKEGTEGQMNPPPPGFPTCGEFDWSSEEFEKAKKGYSNSWIHQLSALEGGGIGAAVGFTVGILFGILGTYIYAKCGS